jgi:hypothetical protein
MARCTATTNAGTACRAPALHGRDVCGAHAGIIGGSAPGAGRPPNDPTDPKQFARRARPRAIAVVDQALDAERVSLDGETVPDWPMRLEAARIVLELLRA